MIECQCNRDWLDEKTIDLCSRSSAENNYRNKRRVTRDKKQGTRNKDDIHPSHWEQAEVTEHQDIA
jgi:hypothetical protein